MRCIINNACMWEWLYYFGRKCRISPAVSLQGFWDDLKLLVLKNLSYCQHFLKYLQYYPTTSTFLRKLGLGPRLSKVKIWLLPVQLQLVWPSYMYYNQCASVMAAAVLIINVSLTSPSYFAIFKSALHCFCYKLLQYSPVCRLCDFAILWQTMRQYHPSCYSWKIDLV